MEKLKEGLSPTFYKVQIFLYFDLNIKLKLIKSKSLRLTLKLSTLLCGC